MDFGDAIAELRVSPRQRSFREGRAHSLFNPQDWAYVSSTADSTDRYCTPLAKVAEKWARSSLGQLLPAARMDAVLSSHIIRLILQLGHLREERLHLLLFDETGAQICERVIASCSESHIVGRFRPIVAWALAKGAHGLLLAHNHPSGDASPSPIDIEFTHNIGWLCKPLEINLLDHVIIAGQSALSMRLAGFL
jgi:DNA repair protein RadC